LYPSWNNFGAGGRKDHFQPRQSVIAKNRWVLSIKDANLELQNDTVNIAFTACPEGFIRIEAVGL
jgi:hypothetical protein